MNGFIFINPFQNEKDSNGLPKIALKKSGTETLKSPLTPLCKRGGFPFSEPSPEEISSFSKGGLRWSLANFWVALIFASLYQDKEVRESGEEK